MFQNQQEAQPSTKYRGSMLWQVLGNIEHHWRSLEAFFLMTHTQLVNMQPCNR